MKVKIRGHRLPGRRFTSEGALLRNVHVGVQEGREPVGLVPGDAASAEWNIDVRPATDRDGELDVRGPAVHGKRGERFVYLTWGDVGSDGSFRMFRRAKLTFADIDPVLVRTAASDDVTLIADVELTDECGGPRCARVRAPAVTWRLE